MRAVHAYLTIDSYRTAIDTDDFLIDLFVWKLSVIRNKKLGFTTVLYASTKDKPVIEKVGLVGLYDEINYVDISKTNLPKINLKYFWAAFKFIAIEEEIKKGKEFFIMDIDLVFMTDAILNEIKKPILVWGNTEKAKKYPPLDIIGYPEGFVLPKYIKAKTDPINTAIIKIDNQDILKCWLKLAWDFMIDNPIKVTVPPYGLIITVEQRFLANIIKNKYKENINFFMIKQVRDNFGPEHFHIWGAKKSIMVLKSYKQAWIKFLLLALNKNGYDSAYEQHYRDTRAVNANIDSITIPSFLEQYLK